jgi:hypothetical protein
MKTMILILLVASIAGCAIVPLDPFYHDDRGYDRSPGYYGHHHYPDYAPNGYGYYSRDGRRDRWYR